ncbi:serine-rich adhesin for platelets [Anastrepha obliqua]|uniref:serine-rich adhesin for platelets n=1 Tax=Anastrepha obliqua TaxID=95512 RepID=UPI002409F589|nr:serine-rich adhesin for platelets [Anastrepha obliqua]
MRRPKMFGLLFWLLELTLLCISNAQGTFEDAETSNDYTSGITHQQFDLRHTIPGEPDIDYPVYSEVPSTRFECTGKHEGYYADMETRCQVFRICAHTSRTIHGFGFLCPNGTLFSQKNFVCDWYRNVNCDESEQYYSKNNVNRIGSSYDMMERVRQMMEYPIKTISQALKSSAAPQATRSHNTLKKQLELAESGLDVSETDAVQQSSRDSSQRAYLTRKQAVTRAQVESVSKSTGGNQHTQVEDAVTQQRKKLQQQRQIQRTETKTPNSQSGGVGSTRGTAQQPQQATRVSQAKNAAKPDDEDVYVNSLGELSSDPGVSFVHESARIIAEPTSRLGSEQKRNFAEKVNVALNDLTELPAKEIIAPDYVKNLRQSNEDLILAANINNLLEEVSDDLNPSISGYQVPAPQTNKTSFRFLSRGFSSQSDRAKRPHYEYAKPKQTASTIRFTPNELPIDDTYKDTKNTKEFITQKENSNGSNGSTYESTDETIQFTFMTTTSTPIEPAEIANEAAANLATNIAAGEGFSKPHDYDTTTVGPTATTTTATYVNQEKYYLNSVGTVPMNLDYNFLSPPETELTENVETTTADAPTLYEFEEIISPAEETSDLMMNSTQMLKDLAQTNTTTVSAILAQTKESSSSVDTDDSLIQQLLFPPKEDTTEIASTTQAPAEQQMHIKTYPAILDEDKLDVENQAAKLLLAGVKLTQHVTNKDEENTQRASGSYSAILDPNYGEGGALFIHVDDETVNAASNSSGVAAQPTMDATTSSTTTTTTTTAQPLTSTTVIASMSEGGSFQERIRNYRRLASKQRATAKPIVYEKRTKLQIPSKTTTTTSPTISSSTTTPRSYLKRVAASRLRLSRLAAANNRTLATTTSSTTTAAPIVEYNNSNQISIESSQTSRKIAVRNIDKELGGVSGGKRYDARGNSFDGDSTHKRGATTTTTSTAAEGSTSIGASVIESMRNSFRRFQASRKPSTEQVTSFSSQHAVTKPTRSVVLRARSRYDNFKKQTNATRQTSSTTTTTTAPPAQSVSIGTGTHAHSPTPNLDHLLKSITSSVSYSTSSSKNQAPTVAVQAPQSIVTYSMSSSSASTAAPITDSASFSSSSSSITTHGESATFLDFEKLTRAIVDDSILQNFQSQQASSQPTVVYQSTPAQTPRALSLNSNARTVGNSVTQSYNKLPPQAPAQLTPPQRPQHLLPIVNSHAPTSPAPRIIIARAEGQRIPPNSVSSIISALATQPPPKPTPTSYVPLDDFLTKKFGQTAASYTKTNTPTNNNNQQQTAQTQQQQQQYGQTQSQQQYYFQKAPTSPATFVGQTQQPQAPYQQVAAIASTYLASPQQQQHFGQQNQQTLQLAQQEQLQQLQQIQKQQQQQLKEQQFFQQFTSPQVQQQQAVRLTQPQQQQQYNTNRIYQTSQQQPLWQQQPQIFQQKQNQQYSTQQTHTYLQPKQTQQHYQSQQTTATQLYYPHQQQQQQQQHQSVQQVSAAAQQQQQQQTSLIPPSFFNNFKQQQQQLPQFPPLGNSITSARPGNAPLPHQHQTLDEFNNSIVPPEHDNHLNIQLPALTAGLIPAPTTPVLTAQRRMDVVSAVSEAESSSAHQKPSNAYNGVSSYDVPLSSIGRLPNDITQLLRRLRAIK